jgi:hypothetical protein
MLTIQIQDVKLKFETNNQTLIAYAKDNFADYARVEEIPEDCYNIKVKLFWLKEEREFKKYSSFRGLKRIGKNYLVGKDTLVWNPSFKFPGLILIFVLSQKILHVRGIYHPFSEVSPSLYYNFMNYLVYYPIFWYLELFRGLHLLHASAVSFNDFGIIISGIGGSGKSIVELILLFYPQAKFISDNLIFYDSHNIYSCYEPVRVDSSTVEHLRVLKGDAFQQIAKVAERRIYRVKRAFIMERITPKLLFLPIFLGNYEVNPLPYQECIEKILLINELSMELNDYYFYQSVLKLLHKTPNLSLRRGEKLEKLLSGVKCYELCIRRDKNFDALERLILKCINEIEDHKSKLSDDSEGR